MTTAGRKWDGYYSHCAICGAHTKTHLKCTCERLLHGNDCGHDTKDYLEERLLGMMDYLDDLYGYPRLSDMVWGVVDNSPTGE